MTFSEVVNSQKLVLVDFSAVWCGPCKMMAPILENLKSRIGDEARVVKIDVDKNESVAQSYQIMSVPTLILFKDGEVIWRKSGVVQANELERLIKSNNN